jgi:hypothetical protein
MTAEQAYERTIDRRCYLESQGFQVTEIWECQLRRELATNPEMKDFFDNCEVPEPLKMRDAFFGGRTDAICLYHKCLPGEKIRYVDVCSLYPWVLKFGKFPIGHPDIILENFKPITVDSQPYEGLVKCRVLAPLDLLHGVLPVRNMKTKKLTFPLCHTCALNRTKDCEHTDEERAIIGTWVSAELYKAVEMGYKVQKIYEVWHYKETRQFSKDSEEDNSLFAAYVNCFLKLKVEKSGWPSWVKTDADRDQFIHDFERQEGIQLDPAEIEKNEALRSIAKLLLNSFWGKFAQRDNMTQCEYFTDPAEYFRCVFDQENEVLSIKLVSEDMVMVNYRKQEDFVDTVPNTNPIIASYVTCLARLKLYTYLEQLQERVFYTDTDSVIYLTRPGDDFELPIGSFLGDLTDELSGYGNGAYIGEYVSSGPKSYGFAVYGEDGEKLAAIIKIRGFTLNSRVSQVRYSNFLETYFCLFS